MPENEKHKITVILKNSFLLYKQIKQNEISPNTDYLFQNMKNVNLEKTIQQLETIESFDHSFLPRSSF